jgi:hypothetical protein
MTTTNGKSDLLLGPEAFAETDRMNRKESVHRLKRFLYLGLPLKRWFNVLMGNEGVDSIWSEANLEACCSVLVSGDVADEQAEARDVTPICWRHNPCAARHFKLKILSNRDQLFGGSILESVRSKQTLAIHAIVRGHRPWEVEGAEVGRNVVVSESALKLGTYSIN